MVAAKGIRGILSTVARACRPTIACYFLVSFVIYLVTGVLVYSHHYDIIEAELCKREPSRPNDGRNASTGCSCTGSILFICNKCQIDTVNTGYALSPPSAVMTARLGFVDKKSMSTKCIPGYHGKIKGINPTIQCPKDEGIFTFHGCAENRCNISGGWMQSRDRERYSIKKCDMLNNFVPPSSCVVSCKNATPTYKMSEIGGKVTCPTHGGRLQLHGCEFKCKIALAMSSGVADLPITYDGLTSDAPGYALLDAFVKQLHPFWATPEAGMRRLIGYVSMDFQQSWRLSYLNAMDVLYASYSDAEKKKPVFVLFYDPTGVSAFDVRGCDTSKLAISVRQCNVKCAPGFNGTTTVKCADISKDEHGKTFKISGCQTPWGTGGPFTGAFGAIATRRLQVRASPDRTPELVPSLAPPPADCDEEDKLHEEDELLARSLQPAPAPAPAPGGASGGGGGAAAPLAGVSLPSYTVGAWSPCSCIKPCSKGTRNRAVTCDGFDVCAQPKAATEGVCTCAHCGNCAVSFTMVLLWGSYFLQGLASMLIFLCFLYFSKKDESNMQFSCWEKPLGCFCKTLPKTMRIFTLINILQVTYLFAQSHMPKCEKDPLGFIKGECYPSAVAMLETWEDDCRMPELQFVAQITVSVTAAQLLLGYAAKKATIPPAWLYDPMKPGKGFVYNLKCMLRGMGP